MNVDTVTLEILKAMIIAEGGYGDLLLVESRKIAMKFMAQTQETNVTTALDTILSMKFAGKTLEEMQVSPAWAELTASEQGFFEGRKSPPVPPFQPVKPT